MVGKLQIIFGLHPIPIQMGILRQLAIFLQHLRSIAPGPAINPVNLLSAVLGPAGIAAAATTVIPTIVIQG
jgi:hypothetical protein